MTDENPTRRRTPPPPDLHELMAKYGGYAHITPEGWREYDEALALWKARLRSGAFDRAAGEDDTAAEQRKQTGGRP